MDAIQQLDQPIDLGCCRAIRVEIWNADREPGTVKLELYANDKLLGMAPVLSKPDLSRDPTGRRPGVARVPHLPGPLYRVESGLPPRLPAQSPQRPHRPRAVRPRTLTVKRTPRRHISRYMRMQSCVIAALALFTAACGSVRIAKINADPSRYANRTVSVNGRVTNSIGILGTGGYTRRWTGKNLT